MRVLYVIDSLAAGGAETSLAALAPRYAARGVHLHVAYLHDRPGLHAVFERAGAILHSIAGPGGRVGWLRRAAALARDLRPDLVHTTLFEADLAGRIAAALARIPAVTSLVNVTYGPEMLHDPLLRAWKVRGAQLADIATARLARRFHAVSGPVAEAMSRRLLIPRDRIDVVPRGRDPERLGTRTRERAERAREQLGIEEGSLVLAVARQEHQKGLDVLLEAFPLVRRRVPAAVLVVAGREGNQTPLLRGLVARHGLDEAVAFLGARGDVPDLLAAADAFVFPSRREGMPGTVLEAMALEAPIVASDIPTVAEAVADGEHALLVPPEDPEALAAAIVATVRRPSEAAERADRARARFLAHFTIDRVADQMVRFYERALAP